METLKQDQLADLIAANMTKLFPESELLGKEIDIKFVWDYNHGSVTALIKDADD